MSELFNGNGSAHYQLAFNDRVKVLDWVRGIGQDGIDKDRLDARVLAKRAAAMLGKLVTENNIIGIVKAANIKLPRRKSEREEVKSPSVSHADLDIIRERIDRLEAACRAAGVEI